MGISERMKFNDIGIRKKLSQKKKKTNRISQRIESDIFLDRMYIPSWLKYFVLSLKRKKEEEEKEKVQPVYDENVSTIQWIRDRIFRFM